MTVRDRNADILECNASGRYRHGNKGQSLPRRGILTPPVGGNATGTEKVRQNANGEEIPSLFAALEKCSPKQSKALVKHLEAVGIFEWRDLSRAALYEFRDATLENVAASSSKTYFAVLKSVINRYREAVNFQAGDYRDILRVREVRPLKTYLTIKELGRLAKVETVSPTERQVLREFLVSAYTGMRISDVRSLRRDNIQGEFLTYKSRKTGIRATVPLKRKVAGMIGEIEESDLTVSLAGYNKAIRRLCKRAGIDAVVTVCKGGREERGPKWKYVSSHTGRISFCTCLANAGAGIEEIRSMAGHTSGKMTDRYIVPSGIEISKEAMRFFKD